MKIKSLYLYFYYKFTLPLLYFSTYFFDTQKTSSIYHHIFRVGKTKKHMPTYQCVIASQLFFPQNRYNHQPEAIFPLWHPVKYLPITSDRTPRMKNSNYVYRILPPEHEFTLRFLELCPIGILQRQIRLLSFT